MHSLDCLGHPLTYFPFEEHVCTLQLRATNSQAILIPLSATTRTVYTPHFRVADIRLVTVNADVNGVAVSAALLKIHLKRLMGFYVVSVFIPSFFLLGVNTAALWILHPQEYRLHTSVFVIVSLLIEWVIIACNAPKSSGIRAIDVWMSFCIVHALMHTSVHVIICAVSTPDKPDKAAGSFSTLTSRPVSRLTTQVKPMEMHSLYDVLLAKMAKEENENTWTHGYWIMFSARVVSPVLTLLILLTYWPFVVFYTKKVI